MMEAVRSSETLVLTRATRRNIPEDGIVHLGNYFLSAQTDENIRALGPYVIQGVTLCSPAEMYPMR
jgi:hypothetical protein